MQWSGEKLKELKIKRKRLGLPPPEVPTLSVKLSWLKSWYDEVAMDRDYVAVADTLVERRLTARTIREYYELIAANDYVDYSQFYELIREIDRCWFEALQAHKSATTRKA